MRKEYEGLLLIALVFLPFTILSSSSPEVTAESKNNQVEHTLRQIWNTSSIDRIYSVKERFICKSGSNKLVRIESEDTQIF